MDRNQCIRLITLYSEHRFLWDPNDPNYLNRVRRDQAWKKISEELKLTIVELKKKLESLLGSYRREKSREKRSAITGYRAYKSRWYAYKYFSFMPRSREPCDDTGNELKKNTDEPKAPKPDSEKPVETRVKSNKRTASTPQPVLQHRHKRARTSSPGEKSEAVPKAMRFLQQCAQSSALKDHYTTFGHYVANELRKYDPITLAHVKNAICGIIFQADTGKFTHFQNTVEANELGNSIRPDSSTSNNSSPAASPRHVFEVEVPQSPITHRSSRSRSRNASIDIPCTTQTLDIDFVKTEVEETTE